MKTFQKALMVSFKILIALGIILFGWIWYKSSYGSGTEGSSVVQVINQVKYPTKCPVGDSCFDEDPEEIIPDEDEQGIQKEIRVKDLVETGPFRVPAQYRIRFRGPGRDLYFHFSTGEWVSGLEIARLGDNFLRPSDTFSMKSVGGSGNVVLWVYRRPTPRS